LVDLDEKISGEIKKIQQLSLYSCGNMSQFLAVRRGRFRTGN